MAAARDCFSSRPEVGCIGFTSGSSRVDDIMRASIFIVALVGLVNCDATKCTSRAAYRKRLGSLIESDQDVFHIVATANGGADHEDNYDFARGASWNRAIGSSADHLNCYLVGVIKCNKAVAISKLIGSHSCSKNHPHHKKYQGKSAAELYKQGEAALRDLRAEARSRHKEL